MFWIIRCWSIVNLNIVTLPSVTNPANCNCQIDIQPVCFTDGVISYTYINLCIAQCNKIQQTGKESVLPLLCYLCPLIKLNLKSLFPWITTLPLFRTPLNKPPEPESLEKYKRPLKYYPQVYISLTSYSFCVQ